MSGEPTLGHPRKWMHMIILIVLGGILGSTVSFFSVSSFASIRNLRIPSIVAAKTVVTNGADQWENDNAVTAVTTSPSFLASSQMAISSLFNQYYQHHGGAQSLGDPVTVAFPVDVGLVQFFTSGALLLPTSQQARAHNSYNMLAKLADNGQKDPSSGIVRLSLLQALLTVGSQAPVGGAGSSITYVDLRKATAPEFMQAAPAKQAAGMSEVAGGQGTFIKAGTRAGKPVGYFIPEPFRNYMNRSEVSPDGWASDFGLPLTRALPFTIKEGNTTHHMLIQVYSRDALLLDQNAQDASGQQVVQRLNTGTDYLRTVGIPNIVLSAGQSGWVQGGEATILKDPASYQPIAHLGQDFPLTLDGKYNWESGMLWYHVQWSTPKDKYEGWIVATNITFTSPGQQVGWASLDALSPDLSAYLASYGSNVGVTVYDVSRRRFYTYNSTGQFIVASSIKVPIMLTFFDMVESQGREPDDDEMNLLTTMIENSNNDSATALYEEVGSGAGIVSYLQKIGVSGLNPQDSAWGYSTVAPQTMVQLLTRLHTGTILTAQDRAAALNLMENIEPDQQVGVGDTAPGGSTVAMKDGWVPGPDNFWAMNSSGIVTASNETYIISVYTQEQPSLDAGQAIVRHVCGTIASLLN